MNTKIQKLNNYLLKNSRRVFVVFGLLISLLIILYIYFLFNTVTYTFAKEKKIKELDYLVVKNIDDRNKIFKTRLRIQNKELAGRFERIDKIEYVKKTNYIAKVVR